MPDPEEARPQMRAEDLYRATGYSVGARGLMHREGRVLLALNAHDRTWRLPGGTLDPGETPADAVRRSMHRCLGLEVEVAGFLGVIHCPSECYVHLVFEVRSANGCCLDPDGDEVLHAMWFRSHALPRNVCRSVRAVLDACGGLEAIPFLVSHADAEACIFRP